MSDLPSNGKFYAAGIAAMPWFAKGLAFGFVLAATVGPIAIELARAANLVSGLTILGFAVWQLAPVLR